METNSTTKRQHGQVAKATPAHPGEIMLPFLFKKGDEPMHIELEQKRRWRLYRKTARIMDEDHGVSDKDLFCACAVVGSIFGVMLMIGIAMWRAL